MTTGKIYHQEAFLQKISQQLGRDMPSHVERPTYKYAPQNKVFPSHTASELVIELKKQAERNLTDITITTQSELPTILRDKIKSFGKGETMIWKDERYQQFGLDNVIKDAYVWDIDKGTENIQRAETARNAIAFSDITMAESAAIVHFHHADHGRTFSFLPENYIVIIPQSTIVPRMTQAAKIIHDKVVNGELLPSCINFICGPSNSADIELNKVVGVHGPVRSVYIIVTDR